MTITEHLRICRKVSTPLIGISTADQFATMATITRDLSDKPTPIIQWDCARGFLPLNKEGKTSLAAILPKDEYPGVTPGLNLVEALTMAMQAPDKTLIFMMNAHRFFQEPAVIQGILNLREPFKNTQRTLVLLGAVIQLPIELQQDVMTFDEALPGETVLRRIVVNELAAAADAAKAQKKVLPAASDEDIRHSVEALAGLAEFTAEQSTAMVIAAAERLDPDQMWERKRAFISQTRGLKFDTTRETFADVGGLDAIKEFGTQLFTGKYPPRAVVRIDEIEKHMAGASGSLGGDSSGVSQDALGVILREMEDNAWRGVITFGPPGGGKSIFTKTLGRTFGVPTLELDLGALKGSLVGQSEENIRNAMKVIKAIAGLGAYFVATCNKLDVLPPELRRRFVHGIYFFDLPTRAELAPIWAINLAKFGLTADMEECLNMSKGWTGAEVRNVCRLAEETGSTLEAASRRIVPVSVSDPDSIDRSRRLAAGKFISATHGGPYVHAGEAGEVTAAVQARRFMDS